MQFRHSRSTQSRDICSLNLIGLTQPLLSMSNAVLISFTVTGRSSLQLEAWDSVK